MQGIAGLFGHALIRGLPFTGVAHETHVTGRIDHEEAFARVACLLATVIFLRLLRVVRTLDGPFGPIEKKGGGSRGCGRWRRQPRGQVVGCTSWTPLLGGQGLIQHRMPQMHPRVRMRWRPPKELSLQRLNRMLFHRGQDEEPCVGRRWERTGVIRRVAAARAGCPSMVRSCR